MSVARDAVPTDSRVRMSADARKAQIIDAARQVFIEHGIHGARSRMIADRAGITEAYLYRHFRSKDDLYRLAVDVPLAELIERLRVETHELSQREDVKRSRVLLRCHELFLGCMVELAPLIVPALFADPDPRHGFYNDYLFPTLRRVLEQVVPDVTGWPVTAFELDVFVEAMIGIHLTVALEHMLEGKPVDVAHVARQITRMFALGVKP